MYCPSCGTEVTRELNYCNRCGANLNPAANVVEQPVRLVSVTGPYWAIAFMVVMGLGIIFSGLNALVKKDLNSAAVAWIGIISLVMFLSIVSRLIRQLSNVNNLAKPSERPSRRKKANKDEPRPAQLPPTRIEPVPSVTENTTRTLDPVERRS
ncbi:MAG TPA: zinc ribbon domain-containing protein [Pyrinomonadaceae bacterium]|nr:zinc ribbon domain-containing protein [Pyrinomonadaceae bacterium]